MKTLSEVWSEEILLKPRYAICRFMKSKVAFKNKDGDKKVLFSIKKIQEEGVPEQIQFHVRLQGKDYWSGKEDVVDVDFYVDIEDFKREFDILEDMVKD
jgi:hypothetical protein